MSNPRVARLGHVGIAVEDRDRSVKFYTEVLGLKLTEEFYYDESLSGHGVAVLSGASVRGAKETVHHRFVELDIPIVNARIGGPGNHARFCGLDPDGNVIEGV